MKKFKNIDEEKLVPELKDWKKHNKDFNLEDWIACEGNIKLAIGFTSIFWPEFIQHDGCIFLKSHFLVENYNHWKYETELIDYCDLEIMINHIHIVDLFSIKFSNELTKEEKNDMSYEQVYYLGRIMTEMYSQKLKFQFPKKKFTVVFWGDKDYTDLSDIQFSFYQNKNIDKKINKKKKL